MPCAVRMANGIMMSTAADGLKPDTMTVNTIKIDAMELREAKKPLAVEISPVKARAIDARPIIGDKKTDWMLPLQEKNGKNASLIFGKKLFQEKFFAKNNWSETVGYLNIS